MPIRTAIWQVDASPRPLLEATLTSERQLEDMIIAAPQILSDEWMLIGRQEDTGFGGRVDLLAVAPDGSLILIELKRDRTPREVVAQAIDYAGWVQKLRAEDIAAVYSRFAPGRSLAEDFRARFGRALDEEALNENHQIVIVAASLDMSSERIVAYLSERDISINVLCFQVIKYDKHLLLSRAWLLAPVKAQVAAATPVDRLSEPWNGEFYASFGVDHVRPWADAIKYGFFSAGGGAWYSRTLQLLKPGDRVWVKIPGVGYVGVGRVTGTARPAAEFRVPTTHGEKLIFDVPTEASYRHKNDDLEHAEYLVPIRWLDTVPLSEAVQEVGMFGNQNSVCKPTTPAWRATVEWLKQRFTNYDGGSNTDATNYPCELC